MRVVRAHVVADVGAFDQLAQVAHDLGIRQQLADQIPERPGLLAIGGQRLLRPGLHEIAGGPPRAAQRGNWPAGHPGPRR